MRRAHSRLRNGLAYVAGAALVLSALIPSPYVFRQPGPAFDTLGTDTTTSSGSEVIGITGAETYPTTGALYMLTVNVAGNPDAQPSWLQTAWAFFGSSSAVMPIEAYFPAGTSTEDEEAENEELMASSQQAAIDAALVHLGLDEDAARPEVTISLSDVGGPSAGLMFTLAIIDKLTPGSLTGGEAVAGTGTISADGTVGAIGGARQKVVTVADKGVKWFLLPSSNCSDLADGGLPEGVRAIPVDTLDDALDALSVISTTRTASGLPECPGL